MQLPETEAFLRINYHCELAFPQYNKNLVFKETVVLRRWEIETEVDKGRITTVRDLESCRFQR